VAATSATSAWAVGSTGAYTLIERWNGTAWKQVPSPTPTSGGSLNAVAATSGRNAWAVGSYGSGPSTRALIEHWNGTAWKQVPSPGDAGNSSLNGVAATSATNTWAVGLPTDSILILRCNGTA
jgi:hypothetical protein